MLLKLLYHTSFMKICIVLPTYNERVNIARIVPAIFRSGVPGELHILVVDDNSPDGTATEVERLHKTFPRLHLLKRTHKQGLGAAYIAGFAHALNTLEPDVLFEMDADFSHAPSDISRLLAALKNADLAIGSRYIRGGKIIGWSLWRKLVSRGGNMLSRILVGLPVVDCTAGFRAWSVPFLNKLDLTKLGVTGYAFQLSILQTAIKKGARVKEIPVTFTERQEGVSKLGKKDIVEFFRTALKLAVK